MCSAEAGDLNVAIHLLDADILVCADRNLVNVLELVRPLFGGRLARTA